MSGGKLYAVFYRPRYGNYDHWALYLKVGRDDHHIFQVLGEHPNFVKNTARTQPQRSRSFRDAIFLADLNAGDIEQLMDVVKRTPVDNEVSGWDCQEYVLDILQELESECIVDEVDEEYKEAKAEVKGRRGGDV